MEIILTAVKEDLVKAFETNSKGLENVRVYKGTIFDVDCDAMVSPANSFGFMDGGIDAFFVGRFGTVVQDNVRMAILRHWHGEIPIGAAEIVATQDDETPYLIAAPTMRVPMILDKNTINPYLAMRAVIMAVRQRTLREGPGAGKPAKDHIQTIAVPGMGTGCGRVSADQAAFQMCEAIRLHISGRHFFAKIMVGSSRQSSGTFCSVIPKTYNIESLCNCKKG